MSSSSSDQDEDSCMKFVFVREESLSQREKVKAFWKFLDSQNCLQPHQGTLEYESSSEAESPVSSVDEAMKEKDIWRKGLKVFQQLGLDKTALAADKRCRPCQMYKTIRIFATSPHIILISDMSHESRHLSRVLYFSRDGTSPPGAYKRASGKRKAGHQRTNIETKAVPPSIRPNDADGSHFEARGPSFAASSSSCGRRGPGGIVGAHYGSLGRRTNSSRRARGLREAAGPRNYGVRGTSVLSWTSGPLESFLLNG